MQKFIVKKKRRVGIEAKDLALPFIDAEIEIEADTFGGNYSIFVVATTMFSGPVAQRPDNEKQYLVFLGGLGRLGFLIKTIEGDFSRGGDVKFYDLKPFIEEQFRGELSWTYLDTEKDEQTAMDAINIILYVSHVCHHTSTYRKIQKKYEKRNHAVDITNPEPKRQFLSGGVYIEWANDRDEQLVHKYTRRTEGWDVRGHYRHYKSGKVVFVKPHHKGKPGCTTVKEFETKGDMMVHIEREITKEEFEQAKKEGASVLIDDSVKCGYGLYGCEVVEKEGKYLLRYDRGNSCD